MLGDKQEGGLAKKWTHSECFAHFGTVPGNPRWSWSGRSPDGQTVSVTLWRDRFTEQGRVYQSFENDRPGEWRSRPGYVELIDNLQHARDHLDGVVRVIVAAPKDPNAWPRAIAECYPQKDLHMKVVDVDPATGLYRLERV